MQHQDNFPAGGYQAFTANEENEVRREEMEEQMIDEVLSELLFNPREFFEQWVFEDNDSNPIVLSTYGEEYNELVSIDIKRWAKRMMVGGWAEAKNDSEFLHNLFAQPFEAYVDYKVEKEMM